MEKKWYVVHVNTGFENKIKVIIDDNIENNRSNISVEEVLLPTETVVEAQKGGKKKTSVRKFFLGYILVKMSLDEHTWHFIRNIPKVIGFVGGKIVDGKIDPNSVPSVDEKEVAGIKTKIKEGKLKPIPKIAFEKGETVKVIDGPFNGFNGTVEKINEEKRKLEVMVKIFGRKTPLELSYMQVEKI